ncbi:MAG: hypothetical protein QXQ46_10940, partial [Thermoplasmatales archaeon]
MSTIGRGGPNHKIENVTPVVITNVPSIRSLEVLKELFSEIIIVTNVPKDYFYEEKYKGCKIINSNSQNFAYLRNLGAYYAPTPYIFVIDSDEEIDNLLINSISTCKLDRSSYSFQTKMYFGDKLLNISESNQVRLYDKNVHFFIRRVHEILYGNRQTELLPGLIINKSYNDWNHYKTKRSKYVALDYKNWKLLFRILLPIYNFLRRQGWRDGVLGLKWTWASIIYVVMVLFYGKSKHI